MNSPRRNKNTVILYNPLPGLSNEDRGVPLSILSVAAPLEKRGFRIVLLDAKVQDHCVNRALRYLDDAVCVGITTMTGPQIKGTLEMATAVRRAAPEVPIVLGGWHPTLLPEETLRHPLVDMIVKGQGDNSFCEIIDRLTQNVPLDDVKGVLFKRNGEIVKTECRLFEDINDTLTMPYHLLEDIEKYMIHDWYGNRMLSYMSSFGCPQRCSFCAENSMSGGRWKALSAERVIGEIKTLVENYALDGIQFYDSNFFTYQERVKQICEGFLKHNLKIKWGNANGSAKILLKYNPETWELMARSGCSEILIGAESGDDEMLRFLRKDVSAEDYVRVKKIARQYGIKLWVSLMLGIPFDLSNPQKTLKREYKACTELVKKLYDVENDDRFALFVYTPYPGTPLYEHSLRNGVKVPTALEEWGDFSLRTAHIPWMTAKHLRLTDFLMNFIFVHSKPLKHRGKQFDDQSRLKKMYLTVCHVIVYLRLKANFFGLPYETLVINTLKSIRNKLKALSLKLWPPAPNPRPFDSALSYKR